MVKWVFGTSWNHFNRLMKPCWSNPHQIQVFSTKFLPNADLLIILQKPFYGQPIWSLSVERINRFWLFKGSNERMEDWIKKVETTSVVTPVPLSQTTTFLLSMSLLDLLDVCHQTTTTTTTTTTTSLGFGGCVKQQKGNECTTRFTCCLAKMIVFSAGENK